MSKREAFLPRMERLMVPLLQDKKRKRSSRNFRAGT